MIILVIIIAIIGTLILKETALYIIILLVFLFGYDIFFESIWQRTPAKWLTKTKVVMTDGSKPNFLHILGRTLARYIPFEAFSFLFGPIGWHDSLSRTLVVPAAYTETEIKQINLNQPNTAKSGLTTPVIIIVIVFIFFIIISLLSSVVLLALNSAREKSRDAKRVADVRQMITALELYYNDNNGYPYSLYNLVPNYIGVLPLAPTPSDGNCTPEQNNYIYITPDPSNYTLSFCLGDITGGLSAGPHSAGPQGIENQGLMPDNNNAN